MARNRVIYQSEALYASKNINSTASGEHRQLTRIQSANYKFDIARKDINQFGQLARIDALVLDSPTVGLDFTYYPTDGFNERVLGFYVQTGYNVYTGTAGASSTGVAAAGHNFSGYVGSSAGNFASGQMGNSSGQNFFIVTTSEGVDLNFERESTQTAVIGGNTGTGYISALSGKSIIGIGNAFLTNYSLDTSVGNLPIVNVSMEGLNLNSARYAFTSGTPTGISAGLLTFSGDRVEGFPTPLVNPTLGVAATGVNVVLPTAQESTGSAWISALRPGDIVLDFTSYGSSASDLSQKAVPNVNISGTTDGIGADGLHLQKATLTLPLKRTPINRLGSRFAFARAVDFPIVASLNVSAIVNEVEARNLAFMLDDSSERDITVRIKNPTNGGLNAMVYTLKGSRLTSESFTSSIGANKSVDLVFETQIGGPNDTLHGIFVSGAGVQDPTVIAWGY